MAMSGPGFTPYGGHAGPVLAVAYAPDGATLASGGRDGIVQVWNARTGAQQHQFTGHTGQVNSVAYSPDGTTLATAGGDGTVRIWDTRSVQLQHLLAPHIGAVHSIAYSPDGSSLAADGDDGKIRIWDVRTGQLWFTGRGSDAVWPVTYAPDGAAVATASRDGTVRIWDIRSGGERLRLPGHTDQVHSIAWAPDGATLATADSSGTIRIWNPATKELQHWLTGHSGVVRSVAYAPDGSLLASAGKDGTVRIWDPGTSEQKLLLSGHAGDVWSVAYAPEGSALASAGNDGTVRIWDPSTSEQKQLLTSHTGEVRAVAYAPDGHTMASGGKEDGIIRIWDTRTGQQQGVMCGHTGSVRSMAYAPDGAALASAGQDDTVRIWDIRSRKQLLLIPDLNGVRSVTYAPDGITVASGDDSGTIWIWDAGNGNKQHELTGHVGPVHSIAYCSDGTALASAGSDGTVRIWDTQAGIEQRRLMGHTGGVRAVAYSPDDSTLASGDDNGTVCIWDARSGDQWNQLAGHIGGVRSIAYSPDGTTLATAGLDGTARIRDANNGHEQHQLTGHTGPVQSIAYSPDGTTIATAGDMTIRIWNSRNGVQIDGTGFGAPRRIGRPLAGVHNDAPSERDLIAATPDAETLADLIASVATAPPLAIALIGDWGVGKSSVMLQIQRRVDFLAKMSRNNPGRSVFVANVRQVRFNAWHYCDDRLWSGLVDHLFRTLATDPDVPSDPDTASAERTTIRGQLSRLEVEKEHLSEALQAADTRQPTRWLARMGSPVYISRIMAITFRSLVSDLRAAPWILLAWAALGGAAYAAWSLWGSPIGAAAAAVTVVIAPAVAVGQRLLSWHRTGLGITRRLRQRLDDRQRAINQEIASLKERLALVDARSRLSMFLNDRASPHAYQEFRGLLGQVRSDLERLSSDLAGARREWEASRGSAAAPLERIVLYIDDLDRCPPDRVVEVLEAIHLMLTLDLFVVVVAVDARWLIKSLECHYQDMFSASKGSPTIADDGSPESDDDSGPASPVDYLDKIFQIPYVLTRPSTEAIADFLRVLMQTAGVSSTRFGRSRRPGSSRRTRPDSPEADQAENGGSQATKASEAVDQPRPGRPPDPGSGHADDDQEGHPHTGPTEESDPGLPDLRPLGLQLSRAEVEFMARLGAVMPTPRAAKRLANLYRLVRIGIPNSGMSDFIGSEDGGAYQVVQILLAVLVGSPATAQHIFHAIGSAAGGSDIRAVLADTSDFTEGDFCGRIHAVLVRISGDIPLVTAVEEYQRWCPALARYSFHTRTMMGEPPSQSDAFWAPYS